jgi:murein DD-endopeptidase MepM/ murein hydrolase activator NlpD
LRSDIPHSSNGTLPATENTGHSPNMDGHLLVMESSSSSGNSISSNSRRQAAMIGVAISVGACSAILLPSTIALAADPMVVEAISGSMPNTLNSLSSADPQVLLPIAKPKFKSVVMQALPAKGNGITNLQAIAQAVPVIPAVVATTGSTASSSNASSSNAAVSTGANVAPSNPMVTPANQPDEVQAGLAALDANSPSLQPGTIQQYQVNPGDTLASIARDFSVSYREIIQLNQLADPNQLKANQVIQIPALATTTNLASASVASANVASASLPAANVTPANVTSTNAVAAKFAPAHTIAAAPVDAALPVTTLAKTPLPAIGGEAPKALDVKATGDGTPGSTTIHFTTSKLLSEINGIRNSYQRQTAPYQTATTAMVAATPVAPTAVAPIVTATAPAQLVARQAPTVSVNPDFGSRKTDSSLAIELRNFVQPKLKPEEIATSTIIAPGKPLAGKSLSGTVIPDQPVVLPTVERQVIARATVGSEAYAPVTAAVGKMVSPNLPPIGREDAYLPGAGTGPSNGYVWPSKGMLSSAYGWRWGRMHKGIDIAAPTGTPIVAAAAGTVVHAGWSDGGYGYMVEVEHADGNMTRYGHNDRVLVSKGQQVSQGQQVSEMGSTGFSTGPHLHFEVHPRGQGAVNPMAFLNNQS